MSALDHERFGVSPELFERLVRVYPDDVYISVALGLIRNGSDPAEAYATVLLSLTEDFRRSIDERIKFYETHSLGTIVLTTEGK